AGRRGLTGAAAAFALSAMALWLEPVYMTLYFGQINLVLLVLAIVDLALPDSCRWKGIGIGIAAGMKLTPLILIPFLLASRRIRAGLVALATFAVTVAVGSGFIVLPPPPIVSCSPTRPSTPASPCRTNRSTGSCCGCCPAGRRP